MKRSRALALSLLLAFGLAAGGCSTFKRLTGEVDDSVLPGQREAAIPDRPVFPDPNEKKSYRPAGTPADQTASTGTAPVDTSTAASPAPTTACKAGDPACAPSGDVFSDPQ